MAKKLAEIVEEAFPKLYPYMPRQVLEKLFQHQFYSEQDHNLDVLSILTKEENIFHHRVSMFLKCLAEPSPTFQFNDETLTKIICQGTLSRQRCENFQKYVEAWKSECNPAYTLALGTALDILYHTCSVISPTSLYTLWELQHESKLEPEEKEFILTTIDNWPMIDKESERSKSISKKFQTAYSQLLPGRRERRKQLYKEGIPDHYRSKNDRYTIYDTMNNVDHELYSWCDRLTR